MFGNGSVGPYVGEPDWTAGGRSAKTSVNVGNSFELLPLAERVQQYREMADATLIKAQTIEDPEMRKQYLNMAAGWHALAQQLEAGNPDPEAMPDMVITERDHPNPRS